MQTSIIRLYFEHFYFTSHKDETYRVFKEFYHRELIPVSGPESLEAFTDWHSRFIVKQDKSSGKRRFHDERGRGIGWDPALSTQGWVMIEANSVPGIQKLAPESVGVRYLMDALEK